MNEELYREEREAGNAFREKQKAEIVSLVERMRLASVEERDRYHQFDTTSLAAYERSAAVVREQLRDSLGWPLSKKGQRGLASAGKGEEPPASKVIPVATDALGEIYRLEIDAGYGLTTYGLLFLPHRDAPHPLVISQHGGLGSPESCSGFYGNNNYNDMTRRILREGIAVFAPQLYLWDPETLGPEVARQVHDNQLKQLGSSITAVEIYKIQRALDYLLAREDMDRSKVGMIGLSYGGFYTLFTAALDLRIKAAYSSCFLNNRFVYDRSDYTWFNSGNLFLDAEICGLIAPRFLHVEVGKDDPILRYEHAQSELDRAAARYERINMSHRFHGIAFEGRHELNRSNEGIERFCNAVKE